MSLSIERWMSPSLRAVVMSLRALFMTPSLRAVLMRLRALLMTPSIERYWCLILKSPRRRSIRLQPEAREHRALDESELRAVLALDQAAA